MSGEETPRGRENQSMGEETAAGREEAIAAALAEFLDRTSREEFVDIDAFCREHPSLEEELRPLLRALAEMDETDYSQKATAMEPQDPLPERLSGHKILSEIGAGGMGRVLLAFDEGLGRKVAVKTLSPRYAHNPKLRERFMREARALARLDHPNVVRIYNLGGANEEPHFVMEYIE